MRRRIPADSDPQLLSAIEEGVGLLLGADESAVLPRAVPGASPRCMFENVVREALRRPPCLVSFSGGRDSSAVLAVAADLARREGLDLPIPISLRFPACESADEDHWQAAVVEHIGLPYWSRLEFHDEMDIVGPIATKVLRRQGVTSPFNAYFHVPIFELASGGSVLSGINGDEALAGGWEWRRENQVLQRREPARLGDAARIIIAGVGPRWARAEFLKLREGANPHRRPRRPDWITPAGHDRIQQVHRAARLRESLSYRRTVENAAWPSRGNSVGHHDLHQLARHYDVKHYAPFGHPSFVSALAGQRGWRMPASRTESMRALFGDVLEEDICARSSKAWFSQAFFTDHARTFARSWDGTGLDEEWINVEALRREWAEEPEPDARTYSLLQRIWLARAG